MTIIHNESNGAQFCTDSNKIKCASNIPHQQGVMRVILCMCTLLTKALMHIKINREYEERSSVMNMSNLSLVVGL